MYLYDKIYEAIDNGIQKALILGVDDISVNWHEAKKTTSINIMDQLVDILLDSKEQVHEYDYEYDDDYNKENIQIENQYNQIVEYYNNFGYRYKCNSIDELIKIVAKVKKFDNNSLKIFKWLDTKNLLSFITDSNEEIPLENYNNDKNLMFLKISTDELRKGNNDILIYIPDDHYISETKQQWQNNFEEAQNQIYQICDKNEADKDYDGYNTNRRLIKCYTRFPAKYHCISYQNINGHDGYLPSMGQLRIMSDCLEVINYIFRNINADAIYLNTDSWWSCSESPNHSAWCLYFGETTFLDKHQHLKVLPIFTL